MEEEHEYRIEWQVTFRGASQYVLATSKEEAIIAAEQAMDFDMATAELIDWEIIHVTKESGE